MRNVFILLVGLIVFPFSACGSSPSNRSIEKLFENSTAVIVGEVREVYGSCPVKGYCNRIYIISLEEKTIAALKMPEASWVGYKKFCSNVPLEVGERYTLFLEPASDFNTSDSKKCPLVVDLDGVFEKIGSYVYRIGSPEARIIVNFEGGKYLTNAVVEPNFDDLIKSLSSAGVSK
ncbi:hypothetical protein [Xanthomonas bonasiae]|uniref:hypothetical protein n=1 Tax=Xanthomonas bonasiae TaxID=2810351 RepID=UPI00177F3FF9|nr:hypothetical protein [Xanthomonas surreyensis]MBD7921433.1 hypothetical protein [Xanthomonas surreyensis]